MSEFDLPHNKLWTPDGLSTGAPDPRVLVLWNPASSSADTIRPYLEDLDQVADVREVKTVAGGVERNTPRIQESLPDVDAAISAGGDSTDHFLINAILDRTTPEHMRSTPFASARGGNGDDLAIMLTRAQRLSHRRHGPPLLDVLHEGHLEKIWPMEWTFESATGERIERKVSYFGSLGASALMGYHLNTPKTRDHPWNKRKVLRNVPQGRALLRGAIDAKELPLAVDSEDPDPTLEMAFVAGKRFARLGRLRDNKLSEPTPRVISLKEKRAALVVPFLASFALPMLRIPSRRAELPATIIIGEPSEDDPELQMYASLDGEPLELEPRTRIRIKVSEDPLIAVTNRRKP